jgi:hypothetical protein
VSGEKGAFFFIHIIGNVGLEFITSLNTFTEVHILGEVCNFLFLPREGFS